MAELKIRSKNGVLISGDLFYSRLSNKERIRERPTATSEDGRRLPMYSSDRFLESNKAKQKGSSEKEYSGRKNLAQSQYGYYFYTISHKRAFRNGLCEIWNRTSSSLKVNTYLKVTEGSFKKRRTQNEKKQNKDFIKEKTRA